MRAAILVCAILAVGVWGVALAEVPKTISYQGILKEADGTPVDDGEYEITFRLYNAEEGGDPLWRETHTDSVKMGVFDVVLGKQTPLNLSFDETYWLSVEVGEDGELQPRVELTSAPYACRAATADVATMALSCQGYPEGGWVIEGHNVHKETGNVGIGTADTRSDPLHVYESTLGNTINVDAAPDLNPNVLFSVQGECVANIRVKDSDRAQLQFQIASEPGFQMREALTIDPSGGVDFGAEDLVTTGKVGIGTATPAEKLDVAGAIRLGYTSNANTGAIRWANDDFEGFDGTSWKSLTASDNDWVVSGNHMYSAASGNVGIGTTSPDAKLHIGGAAGVDGIMFPDGSLQTTAAGGGLPPATSGQTLRYNGTAWVASGLLYNNGSTIGIGTTSPYPTAKLHVDGPVVLPRGKFIYSTSPEGHMCIMLGRSISMPGNILIGDNTGVGSEATYLTLCTNGSDRVRVTSDGNVGIGTSSPSADLHVHDVGGTGSSATFIRLTSDYTGTSATDGLQIGISGGGTGAYIENRENASLVLARNGMPKLSIETDGRVLIKDILQLESRASTPGTGADGQLCVAGPAGSRHIYCYLNGAWRQLD